LILGFQTRVVTVLLAVVHLSLVNWNPALIHGEDCLFNGLLLFGIFAPLGNRLSLDFRLNPSLRTQITSQWPVRMMQIWVAGLYFFSWPRKIMGDPAWLEGTAVYYIMSLSEFSRWDVPAGWFWKPWVNLVTYFTLFVEGGFPYLVWFRKLRLPMIFLAVSLQLGIAVFMKNISFYSVTMACSVLVFLPSDFIRRRFHGIRAIIRLVSSTHSLRDANGR
jgi:hypothetical protein